MTSAPALWPLEISRTSPRGRPASFRGAVRANGACLRTAATPRTEDGSWPALGFRGGLRFVTFAPLGGVTSKTEEETGPNEMSVAFSSRIGELLPLA